MPILSLKREGERYSEQFFRTLLRIIKFSIGNGAGLYLENYLEEFFLSVFKGFQ